MTTRIDATLVLQGIGVDIASPAQPELTEADDDPIRMAARDALNRLDPNIKPVTILPPPYTGRISPTLFPTGRCGDSQVKLWRRFKDITFAFNLADGTVCYGSFVQPFTAEDQLHNVDATPETRAFYERVNVVQAMQEEARFLDSNDPMSRRCNMSPVWRSPDRLGQPLARTMVVLTWRHQATYSLPGSILILDGENAFEGALERTTQKSEYAPQFMGFIKKIT